MEEILLAEQSTTRIEQPTKVTIAAFLQFSGGIIIILIGLVLLDLREELAGNEDGGISGVYLVIMFILGFSAFTVGVGLWTMKKWGYQVARIFTIIFFILAILSLPLGFILLVLDVYIFYLLTRPEIKEVFGITGFLS